MIYKAVEVIWIFLEDGRDVNRDEHAAKMTPWPNDLSRASSWTQPKLLSGQPSHKEMPSLRKWWNQISKLDYLAKVPFDVALTAVGGDDEQEEQGRSQHHLVGEEVLNLGGSL